MLPFNTAHTTSYSHFMEIMHHCIYLVPFSRYSKLSVESRNFFIPHVYLVPLMRGPQLTFITISPITTLQSLGIVDGCDVHWMWHCFHDDISNHFDRMLACDGHTDRHTTTAHTSRALHSKNEYKVW